MEKVIVKGSDDIKVIASKMIELVEMAGEFYNGNDIDQIQYFSDVLNSDVHLYSDGLYFAVDSKKKFIQISKKLNFNDNIDSVVFVLRQKDMVDVTDKGHKDYSDRIVNYITNTSNQSFKIKSIHKFNSYSSDDKEIMKNLDVAELDEYMAVVEYENGSSKIFHYKKATSQDGSVEDTIDTIEFNKEQIEDIMNISKSM